MKKKKEKNYWDEWKWNDQKLIKAALSKYDDGMTAGEIEILIDRPGSHRRMSELEQLGLAKRVGKRKCKVTGKMRDLWYDDDSQPKSKPIKKPLVHENRVLKDRVTFLEGEVLGLQMRLRRTEQQLQACEDHVAGCLT